MAKKIYTLIIALISAATGFAQFPGWAWMKSPIGNGGGYANETACATDAEGNVYVTGAFADSTMVFGNYTLTAGNNVGNFFLAKYDPSGNVLWAKTAVGDDDDFGNGVALDAAGNVYVIGWFWGHSIAFPGATLYNSNLTYVIQSANGFVAKYDPDGNFLWARSSDTTGDGGILFNGITTGADGGIYVAGGMGGVPLNFGGQILISSLIGTIDALLLKFDSSGNVTWAKNAGVSGGVANNEGVATDMSGNPYVTGYFYEGSFTFGSTTLTNAGLQDIFVAKYYSNGSQAWAKSAGGALNESGYGIASGPQNNMYVTGYFSSDSITLSPMTLYRTDTGVNSSDFFIADYDSAGQVTWAQQAGGNNPNYGSHISTDNIGNVFVTGVFTSTTFNIGSPVLNNQGATDGFIADYTSTGLLAWVQGIQGTGNDYPAGAAADGNGNCYLVGQSSSPTLQFGSTTFNNTDTPQYQVFIAKAGLATGIHEPVTTGGMMVYPDPCTTGNCRLQTPGDIAGSFLQVYDISGRLVYKGQVEISPTQIPVSNLEAGMYIIKLSDEQNELAGKFVVMR